jgi:hypothetical protein
MELDADFAIVIKPERVIAMSVQSILVLDAATTASDVYIKNLRYCILEVISAFPPTCHEVAGQQSCNKQNDFVLSSQMLCTILKSHAAGWQYILLAR